MVSYRIRKLGLLAIGGFLTGGVRIAAQNSATASIPETYHDKYLVSFDAECLANNKLSVAAHVKAALVEFHAENEVARQKLFTNTTDSGSIAPRERGWQLLQQKALKVGDVDLQLGERLMMSGDDIDAMIGSDEMVAAMDILKTSVHAKKTRLGLDTASSSAGSGRRLSDEDDTSDIVVQRRIEMLSLIHVLAAQELVGKAHVNELLKAEQLGDVEEVLKLVREHAPKALLEKGSVDVLEASLMDKQDKQRRRVLEAQEETEAPPSPVAVVTDAEFFHTLNIDLIENPLLESHMLRLLNMLPCIQTGPEPDSSKNGMTTDPDSLTPQIDDQSPPPTFIPVLNDRLAQLRGLAGNDSSPKKTFTFHAPNDPHFKEQWYMSGAAQREIYGANIINGWSTVLVAAFGGTAKAPSKLTFSDYLKKGKGMTVAVLDSGCSKNADLVNQFWRNNNTLGCNSSTFVGRADRSGKGELDCIGYDFGDSDPDPTDEIKMHGSSTSGLIAAEGDNNLGITGICPTCKVMCLKIYDSDKQKITMSAVVRALEYVAAKKIRLSNHSYGGFGFSAIELQAHTVLMNQGHLAVCSSGNNGCDIDQHPREISKGCKDDNGNRLYPFTPAGYEIASILTIGATTRSGELAWFSNFGAESVDMFAPGDSILTLYGTRLATVKGTSFSSPLVAGVAGVLWAERPNLTSAEVKEILMKSGTRVSKLNSKAISPAIVNLQASLGMEAPDYVYNGSDEQYLGRSITSRTLSVVGLVPWVVVMLSFFNLM